VQDNRVWAEYFFVHGKGNEKPGVKGSLWAAYNGVAELIDHPQPPQQSDERRLESVWFGDGYQIKARAYETAVEVLTAGRG
jgi:hypothetical protein